MLPPRYTQALMLGESLAGLVVSLLRVVTKVSAHSERTGAIAFFSIAVGYIALCACCQVFIMRSKFVKYYVTQAKGSNDTVSQKCSFLIEKTTTVEPV